MSGGNGTNYDAGTVTVTVNGASVAASYGQASTPQTVAQSLSAAINSGNLAVTSVAGTDGALMLTAVQGGTSGNGITVTVSSSSNQPGLFASPSFAGNFGSLSGGGASGAGPLYNYTIPNPTPTTGYAAER